MASTCCVDEHARWRGSANPPMAGSSSALHLLRQPRDGGQLAFDLGLVEGLLGRLNIRNVCHAQETHTAKVQVKSNRTCFDEAPCNTHHYTVVRRNKSPYTT